MFTRVFVACAATQVAAFGGAGAHQAADPDWYWTNSNGLCTASLPCTNKDTCTTVAMGACSSDTTPAWYVVTKNGGLFASDGGPNPSRIPETGQGYLDLSHEEEVSDGTGKYSFAMNGNVYGDLNTNGFYMGVSSYQNVGDVAVKGKVAQIYVATPDNTHTVDRFDSKSGAPVGPYTVCMGTPDLVGACPVMEMPIGSFKFSVFGYTSGSAFSLTSKYLVVRVGMSLAHAAADGGFFVTESTDAITGQKSVTEVNIGNSGSVMSIQFPQAYNYGPFATGQAYSYGPSNPGSPRQLTVEGSKKVIITATVSEDKQSVVLDYHFESKYLANADQYFLYDPTVTVRDCSGGNCDCAACTAANQDCGNCGGGRGGGGNEGSGGLDCSGGNCDCAACSAAKQDCGNCGGGRGGGGNEGRQYENNNGAQNAMNNALNNEGYNGGNHYENQAQNDINNAMNNEGSSGGSSGRQYANPSVMQNTMYGGGNQAQNAMNNALNNEGYNGGNQAQNAMNNALNNEGSSGGSSGGGCSTQKAQCIAKKARTSCSAALPNFDVTGTCPVCPC